MSGKAAPKGLLDRIGLPPRQKRFRGHPGACGPWRAGLAAASPWQAGTADCDPGHAHVSPTPQSRSALRWSAKSV